MKIALIRLPEDFSAGLFEVFTQFESLGLGYVAAALRQAGHQVRIHDLTVTGVTSDLADRLNVQFKELVATQVIQALACTDGSILPETYAWLVLKNYLAQEVLADNPDLVGFTLISNMAYGHMQEMVAYLREHGLAVPIVAGGEQAALYAKDVMRRIPGLDACITGEGEQTLLELLDCLNNRASWRNVRGLVWRSPLRLNRFGRSVGGVVHNSGRKLISDLDLLPDPDRDYLPVLLARGGETVLAGSRGCPARCSFCSIIEFYPRDGEHDDPSWRGRSPKRIVAEIVNLYHTYGADRFWIVDDEFFGGVKEANFVRAEEIFQGLIDAHIPVRFDIFCRANAAVHSQPRGTLDLSVKAGMRRAFIGIESGSTETLKKVFTKGTTPAMNAKAIKVCEAAGIDVLVEFIMFNPWTSIQDIDDNLVLLTEAPRGTEGKLGKYDPMILGSRLYIHRETPLGRDFRKDEPGLVIGSGEDDDFFVQYQFQDPKVGALYETFAATHSAFAKAEGVIEQLYRLTDRFWLPTWSERADAEEVRVLGAHYAALLDDLKMVRSDEALAIFKEILAFVREFDLEAAGAEELLADSVSGMQRKLAHQAEAVTEFVHSMVSSAVREVWEILSQKDLLGKRTRRPF